MSRDYCTDDIKEEPIEFNEDPFDEFGEIKQEEPVLNMTTSDAPNDIQEERMEIKDDFKDEEYIADMYCPSTG
ncbi:hypothetical protein PMAYCL1PPCAC_20812, partial [Pristionchus mayeri]